MFITGAFALEQGLIFSAMILAAMTVYIIEQKFGLAALWAIAAGILSWLGLMHSYRWTGADTVMALGWGPGQAGPLVTFCWPVVDLCAVDYPKRARLIKDKRPRRIFIYEDPCSICVTITLKCFRDSRKRDIIKFLDSLKIHLAVGLIVDDDCAFDSVFPNILCLGFRPF